MNTADVVGTGTHQALEEAADWWAALQDGELSQDEVSEWLAWLEADPRNGEYFAQVNELAERVRFTQATAPERVTPLRLPAGSRQAAGEPTSATIRERSGSRRLRRFALAASLLMAAGFLAAFEPHVLSWRSGYVAPDQRGIYATSTAKQREVLLPDGSRVTLGGSSTIKTAVTSKQRLVHLTAGEAYFEVKHDSRGRPFVVDAGVATVRALGTAFNVRRSDSRLAITVTEGRVQVARAEGRLAALATATGLHRPETVELDPAEQVIIDAGSGALEASAADLRRATAWRRGRLEFVDEPLDVVIGNVSRYSPTPIVPVDADLHAITYTGTFDPQNLESWLGALEQVFHLRLHREPGVIEVSFPN
jgi:transmembrane sensor